MRTELDRRTFLSTSAAAAAAAVISSPTGVAAAQNSTAATSSGVALLPIRLGIASYTFRNFERVKLIGFLKDLGINTVNLKDVKDHLPSTGMLAEDEALAAYREAGIRPTAAGTIYFRKDEDADIREKFEYAKRAGIRVIVAGDPEPKVLPRVERFVKEYDIKLAIHNHGPEDKVWPSPLDIIKSLKGMDVRMGCCVDVGHTMRAGVDPVDAIRAVGARLHNVHMKDLAERNTKESQVAVGRGLMPVRGIFAELIKMKYPGNVDLEYEIHGDDPMPGVIESMAYMRGVLAGMHA